MSDWMKRPLSDEQLKYAEDDVLYLEQVVDELSSQLDGRGRLHWAQEECAKYDTQAYYDATVGRHPDQLFPKLKKVKGLAPAEAVRAYRLLAWREAEAAGDNKPIYFITRDDVITELSKITLSDADCGIGLRKDASDGKAYSEDEFAAQYEADVLATLAEQGFTGTMNKPRKTNQDGCEY